MKKIVTWILVLALLLSMVSCGPSTSPTEPGSTAQTETPAATKTTQPESTPAESQPGTNPATETTADPGTDPATETTADPGTEPGPDVDLDDATLPEVGQVICGFKTEEIREFPMLGAQVIHMVHEKTGADFVYVANNDINRYFALTFGTQPIDNTGLPHVFEHATLSGSKKYPSADLFMNLSYQTYQTLMNAYTYDRMTMYPLGSLSQEQLLALADYYVDSCFHPMIMEDESIYRTEAWRYRLEKENKPLTIEGTVYSEMKGAMTLERQANYDWIRAALPGAFLGFNQGGDPDNIPDMTWDSLKAYHDMFYHPSNCLAMLYGQLDNYRHFLYLLDQEFSQYEAREFTVENPDYVPLTESVVKEIPYPTEASSDPSHSSVINYAIVLPEEAWEESNALSYLTSLLTAAASPLNDTLKRQFPSSSVSGGLEIAGPVPVAIFSLSNAEREDAEAFKKAVDDAIADVIANGFPKDMLDSYAASFELSELLVREESDVGENILSSLAYDAHTFGDVWYYFDSEEESKMLVPWNEDGTYKDLCSRYLSGDVISALVTTYPEPGAKEQKDKELADELAQIKAAMSEEEIKALVEASGKEAEPNPETAAMVKALTVVSVDSLPEEVREYDVQDTTENGTRYIEVAAGVSGVAKLSINLDASFLDGEGLHYLKLYKDLISYLDTAKHSRSEIASLSTRYLYDGHVYVSLMREEEKIHPYLQFTWIARDEDLQSGLDLMDEMFFELDLEDAARIKEGVAALLTATRSDVNSAPYNEAIRRSFGRTSELYRYSAYLGGIEYYSFLTGVAEKLENDPAAVVSVLKNLRDEIRSRHESLVILAGDENTVKQAHGMAETWLSELGDTAHEAASFELPVAAAKEAIVVDSNVQYNGLAADFETLGIEYDAGLEVVTALITDKYLIPRLRDAYGVYGVMHYAVEDLGVYLCTYRDPNVSESFAVYTALSKWLARQTFTQEDIDGYILSSYVGLAMPSGELTGAVDAASSYLGGNDPEKQLTYMRQIKAVTPEMVVGYKNMYAKLAGEGNSFTAGGAGVIKENAERYESVINPFGVIDPADMVFEDVPEGSEAYDAIYYVIRSGYMKPAGDNLFAPAEPATVADLAVYIYMLVGGDYNPEEALKFLQGYQIIPTDAQLTDPATRGMIANAMGKTMELSDYTIQKTLPEGMTLTDADQITGFMKWALGSGLLQPIDQGGGVLAAAPDQGVDRASLAVFMQAFDEME